MNELPAHAQQLIRAAKAADEPPPGALERARERLDAAIAAERSGQTGGSSARRPLWRGAKISLASVVIGLVGLGALYFGSRVPPKPTYDFAVSTRDVAKSVVHDTPGPAGPARAPSSEAPPPRAPAPPPQASQAAPTPAPVSRHAPDLESEMHLLTAAAEAVDQNDFSRAHALLRAHRGRFGSGQLKQERVGLEILMQCLSHSPTAAKRARAYLRSTPYALLSARIQAACSMK